jgi:membrane protease YdiL (CAAX protease family)
MVLVGMIFALLFQGLWFLISFLIGSRFEVVSFPSLRGYEDYAVYSLPAAFVLYLVFAVFGAFAEEVAYRGYVQSRISSRYRYVAGIFVATMPFSLQHIHIFQLSWLKNSFRHNWCMFCFSASLSAISSSEARRTCGAFFHFMP